MKIIKPVILYIAAMLIVAPCLLIISEGDTILPNLIGLCYTYMIYRLSFTNIGKRFVKEINKLNSYITKKL